MEQLNLETNKHLWKSEDLFKVYLAMSTVIGRIFRDANLKNSLSESEYNELEEAIKYLRANTDTYETLGFGEIEDPLNYFFLVTSLTILMECKYPKFTTDSRLQDFKKRVAPEHTEASMGKFKDMLKSNEELIEAVQIANLILEFCKKTVEKNNKFPTLVDEHLQLVKTCAHSYQLLGNDDGIDDD